MTSNTVNIPKKTEVETLPTFQNTYVEDPAPNEENNSKKKNPAAGKITKNKKKETPSKPRYASRNEVELFTTSWCRYCKDAKKFFESRGIAYAEYDVEKDQAAARRFKKLNKRGGVPFALINGQSISGFRKSVYEAALIK